MSCFLYPIYSRETGEVLPVGTLLLLNISDRRLLGYRCAGERVGCWGSRE